MPGVLVRIRINGHRFDAHLLGGLDNTTSNFTTIGDENLVERFRGGLQEDTKMAKTPSEQLTAQHRNVRPVIGHV